MTDREKAIATLTEHLDHWKRLLSEGICTKDEGERTIYALIMAIKALEQTKWIPVSERPPKVPGCYAVTERIGSDLITSVCFFDRPNTWYNDNRINHERNCLTNIVAWMPLPEPCKTESEDKE